MSIWYLKVHISLQTSVYCIWKLKKYFWWHKTWPFKNCVYFHSYTSLVSSLSSNWSLACMSERVLEGWIRGHLKCTQIFEIHTLLEMCNGDPRVILGDLIHEEGDSFKEECRSSPQPLSIFTYLQIYRAITRTFLSLHLN